MSNGHKKREKSILEMVKRLGFTCNEMSLTRNDHYKLTITDDVGNTFIAFTGSSCSACERDVRLNFKQDIRRR